MDKIKKAVVLSSGGVDSTTVMALARSEGYEIYSLSFNYGQRHARELEAARRVAEEQGAVGVVLPGELFLLCLAHTAKGYR